MARKRQPVLFSLSFLDVMSCGFGAVVLVFLIINHSAQTFWQVVDPKTLSEVNLLEREVEVGRLNLAEVRNVLDELELRVEETKGRSSVVLDELKKVKEEASHRENESLSREEQLRRLKTEIENMERDVNRLRAAQSTLDDPGNSARRFIGQGNRQYLTGLRLGGNRILVLLDVSASMLDETIVNVIRRRNMSDERKVAAPKWQRAVATVEWLVSQLPLESEFQLYLFNSKTRAAIAGTEGKWISVLEREQLEQAIANLQATVPADGTSLENAFIAVNEMAQSPDNIFLITDSLPTQSDKPPRKKLVTGRDRQRFFEAAVRELRRDIPVNVILMPMEGDPAAASAFWRLAQNTGGSFMSPSKDWP